jgi:hypothetical protein
MLIKLLCHRHLCTVTVSSRYIKRLSFLIFAAFLLKKKNLLTFLCIFEIRDLSGLRCGGKISRMKKRSPLLFEFLFESDHFCSNDGNKMTFVRKKHN